VQLPDISGLEVCRRIKSAPETRRMPVLHISATYTTEADRLISAQSGADIFLVEPVGPEELITVVRTLIRLRSTEIGLAESEARLRLAVEGAQIATWDMDLRSGNAVWSRRLYQMLGYPLDEEAASWERWQERIHPDDRDAVVAALEETRRDRVPFQREHRIVRADNGDIVWFAPIANIYTDEVGQPTRLLGVVMDVSEQKRVDADRERMSALEHKALSDAEEAARLKDQFLATLSHELRTPLSAMLGWLHLVRSGKLDATATTRALETIEHNARLQNQLINDILDVSRIVSDRLRLDVHDVSPFAVLRSSVESLRPAATARQIDLRVDIDGDEATLRGDAARLQQVFTNVIANAIKFVPQKGKVEVMGRCSRDGLVIEVRDNGEGIEPRLLPHVFERFRQGDGSMTRRHGGLGLGLAIAQHLVVRHGGTIAAQSAGPKMGATFTIALPLTGAPDERAADVVERVREDSHEEHTLEGLAILVVDDNADTLGMLQKAFVLSGASVEIAHSADEALQWFDAGRPIDVLVSDLGMPERDGFDLLASFERRYPERKRDMVAVAASGYARGEDRDRAIAAGFDAHFAKPVDLTMLIPALAELVRAKRANDA